MCPPCIPMFQWQSASNDCCHARARAHALALEDDDIVRIWLLQLNIDLLITGFKSIDFSLLFLAHQSRPSALFVSLAGP